jgi:hypothetical protein
MNYGAQVPLRLSPRYARGRAGASPAGRRERRECEYRPRTSFDRARSAATAHLRTPFFNARQFCSMNRLTLKATRTERLFAVGGRRVGA